MNRTSVFALLGGVFVGSAVLLAAPCAQAMDGEATSDTAAQFYDVRSPTGETVLSRSRVTTTLGVGGYDLLDSVRGDPKAPELSFRARLRYDADYGVPSATVDPSATNSFVPGVAQGSVDLMYAYVEGRRFFGGMGGFKLGRQYVTDVLGWWSFDGAEVALTTPYYVKAELYGGSEQRGGLPLSTNRFEGDGIWRGDRTGLGSNLYPAFQPAAFAPAVGAAIESVGVTWIHARLTYRRVYNTGTSNLTQFSDGLFAPANYDGLRISSERLGYSIDASLANLGGAKAGIVYDFYRANVTSAYASLDAYLGPSATVSADYDYYLPWFDADSIWNFFGAQPRNDVGVHANVDVTKQLSVAASGRVRAFGVQTAPFNPGGGTYSPSPNASSGGYPQNGHPLDEGGDLSVRWHTGETRLVVRGTGDFGDEGNRAGGDVAVEHVFETRYVATGRAGVWEWKDNLRPDRATTSAGYVAGLAYRFAPRSQGGVEWQHDINGLVGQRFRLMFLLSLGLTK